METLFILSAFVILYTFFGYGILITILAKTKGGNLPLPALDDGDLPEVSLLIAAYNEEEILEEKIQNTLALDYPKEKLSIVFVTDGTTDSSFSILKKYAGRVNFNHSPGRRGKIAAINRVMKETESAITVFSDANVMLNSVALRKIVEPFQSNLVAAVSGEKIVKSADADSASSSGEGFYWKYESFLKRMDARWNTLVGSAGELVAIRTRFFEATEEDTYIEDFVTTLRLSAKGYKVDYVSDAQAVERGSANMEEEEKRKVRISAGGIQAILRLPELWKIWKYPGLSFQYFSHRVLRWTLLPLALLFALLSNLFLWHQDGFWVMSLFAQLTFYSLALAGYILRNRRLRLKVVHVPYYFVFMNICVVKGWWRYFRGKQNVAWEKSKRAKPAMS